MVRAAPAIRRFNAAAFPNVQQGIVSGLLLLACGYFLYRAVSWSVIHAVWHGTADECRLAVSRGACWAMISEKLGFVAFGRYAVDERWRPTIIILSFVVLIGLSPVQALWGRTLGALWVAFFIASWVLMPGGIFGLRSVPSEQWGGLVLTVMLASSGIAIAFPLGTVLALARRSRLPAVKSLAIGYIEVVRGVPLITVLFLSSIMLPLVLPDLAGTDKVSRACLAIGLFAAAYMAEIVRGGLQTIPNGQLEAARALGMGYALSMFKVILPQAYEVSIPPFINSVVSIFKDTSLVLVIGLLDFLRTVNTVAADPEWQLFYVEWYLFAAAVYFLFCLYISRVGARIERKLGARFAH